MAMGFDYCLQGAMSNFTFLSVMGGVRLRSLISMFVKGLMSPVISVINTYKQVPYFLIVIFALVSSFFGESSSCFLSSVTGRTQEGWLYFFHWMTGFGQALA
jgi:hypothetical protein